LRLLWRRSARVSLADEITAYAQYLNAPRDRLPAGELALFVEDLAKARAAVEREWLELKPVREKDL
jgi:hypothetical protein